MREVTLEAAKACEIWDSHGHMGPYKLFNVPDNGAEAMLRIMDQSGIERVCVSHMSALEVDAAYGNSAVGEAIAISGGRIMGHAAVNPFEKELVVPELERCFDSLGFSAIKLHALLIGCPPESPLYDPVYSFANERRLVVMAHNFPDVPYMARICEKYPDAFFVQAHCAAHWDGLTEPPYFELARQAPNFYVDCAGSHVRAGVIEKAAAAVGAQKLLFGTDFPFFDPRHQVGYVAFSDIPEKDKRLILGGNFRRLLSLRRV